MESEKFVVVTNPAYNSGFDPNDRRYRCCCNCMHITTATIIVGVWELIGATSNVIGLFGGEQRNKPAVAGGGSFFSVLWLIAVIVLLVGVYKKNHLWLLPHLIMQALSIAGLIILAIVLAVLLAVAAVLIGISSSESNKTYNDVGDGVNPLQESNAPLALAYVLFMVFLIIVLFAAALFLVWFFMIVLKCYRFFRDLNMSGGGSFVQYAPQASTMA